MQIISAKNLIIILVGISALLVSVLSAGDQLSKGVGKSIEMERATIEEQRRAFVLKALPEEGDLNQKFWELDAQLLAERNQNADAYLSLINDAIEVLDGKELDDKTANDFLDQYLELEKRKLLYRKKQVRLLLKHFGPVFVVRFMQVERKFEAFAEVSLSVRIPLLEKQ